MKSPIQPRVLEGIAIVVAGYLLLRFGFTVGSMINVLNGLFIGTALVVSIAFGKLVWRALTLPKPDRATVLVFALLSGFIGLVLMRGWSIWWRSSGSISPGLVTDSEWAGIGIYLSVVSGLLMVVATGLDENNLLQYNKRLLLLAVSGGILVAAALGFIQGV